VIVEIVLPALFTVYLISGLIRLGKSYRQSRNKIQFFKSKPVLLGIRILLILVIPTIIIAFLPDLLANGITNWSNIIGIGFAFAISVIWVIYVRKLDIFEQEKWLPILLVFALSCATIWLVFPISDFINNQGFVLNGEPVNDFLYCVISIGMVEELVKVLPVLMIISSKKIINESYDYLFYASVSALGFAFIENTLYINNSELYSVIARMLVASVAHMTFTTTIFYGVLLSKYKFKRIANPLVYIGFFLLAALSHGFYDFWLINHWATQYQGITLLFFLVTVHIWFTMLNNGLNISSFYNRSIPLRVDRLKTYLVYSLLIIFMLAYLTMGIIHGKIAANQFFWANIFSFGYFFIYIIYSQNRFKIVRGHIVPIDATTNFFIPPLRQNS
jgi:RsiW-degrading membrane proteinase PrsW (M82 family)